MEISKHYKVAFSTIAPKMVIGLSLGDQLVRRRALETIDLWPFAMATLCASAVHTHAIIVFTSETCADIAFA